jgi:divalent metal cation (Fe/Co/Zn/Cd) transporter
VNIQPITPISLLTPSRRRVLARRAQLLAGASVLYNVAEGIIAVAAGTIASSSALVGFGLDSAVEVASGLIILWQFHHPMPESRERRAQRLIAVSFFALAAYIGYESISALLIGARPETSIVGIVLAVASLAIMPLLSLVQRRTGRELNSGAVVADSTQTLLCTYLSAVLLIGLLANTLLGWWWLDPIAALVIAAVAIREGRENWRGDTCGTPIPGTTPEHNH